MIRARKVGKSNVELDASGAIGATGVGLGADDMAGTRRCAPPLVEVSGRLVASTPSRGAAAGRGSVLSGLAGVFAVAAGDGAGARLTGVGEGSGAQPLKATLTRRRMRQDVTRMLRG